MPCDNYCANCKHWRQISPKASARLEGTIGECRQSPPKGNFNWPRTKSIDSCGQYAAGAQFAEGEALEKCLHMETDPNVRKKIEGLRQLTLDAGTPSGGAPLQPSGSGNRQRRGQRAQA